ncbi:uncharacterized protein [Oryctolagus cuniculus]|uniref:uncharacterized protein isoform X3 n=1 Tax=Oryctolagus cuniculus TaxID=9986 RepID=UPI003879EF51
MVKTFECRLMVELSASCWDCGIFLGCQGGTASHGALEAVTKSVCSLEAPWSSSLEHVLSPGPKNKEVSSREQHLQEGPGCQCQRSGSRFNRTLRFVHPHLVQSFASAPSGRLHLKTAFMFQRHRNGLPAESLAWWPSCHWTAHREEKAEA